ncbi:uncharacterized protein KY384_008454 [Bacidia gigantensis]|uniref:uncharacterized protein n=1 Tax=Bacidia gigantensis TaxID=2732470 RepID=UPI001D05BADD|nr:uncharacterized protein KY384_008454 [Bacidia gigantensis]KAG8527025.1 hypothetical protein KY384_008454 [Bacidia gigantensis]
MALNLEPLRPKIGLTRELPYTGLHEHRLNLKKELDDDELHALPESSEDEYTTFKSGEKKQEQPIKTESSPKSQRFRRVRKSVIDSQNNVKEGENNSKKRENEDGENDMMALFSQSSKRARKIYRNTQSQQTRNIHTESGTGESQMNAAPRNISQEKYTKVEFKRHSKLKLPACKSQPEFHVPTSLQGNDSERSTSQDAAPSKKAFNKRTLQCKPHFEARGSVVNTRSSRSKARPFGLTDINAMPRNSHMEDAIETAKTKLHLDDQGNPTPRLGDGTEIDCNEIQIVGWPLESSEAAIMQDDAIDVSSSAKLQPNPSSLTGTSQLSSLGSPPDSPSKARCPLCKTLVDRIFFEGYTGARRLTLKEQAGFCAAHKINAARSEWQERGYPRIEWDRLKDRMSTYHPQIEQLLRGDRPSFYRNALEDSVKSGKNRTLKQALVQGGALEGLSPGYYGSRGAKIFVEDIIHRFQSKLRRLGSHDRLLAAIGPSGYVQAVLAPELAVMLVMDDMKTDEDGARAILRDSVDIGNLLNEEEDEIVQCISDTEDA